MFGSTETDTHLIDLLRAWLQVCPMILVSKLVTTQSMPPPWASISLANTQTSLRYYYHWPVLRRRRKSMRTEVPGSDQTISALISWATANENTGVLLPIVDRSQRLGAGQTCELHELCHSGDVSKNIGGSLLRRPNLVDAESSCSVHQFFIYLNMHYLY